MTLASRDPSFPPLLTSFPVDPAEQSFDAACRAAAAGTASAGDVLWSRRRDRLDCAVVFEPDVVTAQALQVVLVAMVAFGDAIGAVAPPEVGIGYRWPNILLANAGVLGTVNTAVSPELDRDGAPHWMVVGLDVALKAAPDAPEPGHDAVRTTLWDEGCGALDNIQALEAFARHLLAWLHDWQVDGFAAARKSWLARGPRPGDPVSVACGSETADGCFAGLDADGGLLLEKAGEMRVIPLADAVIGAVGNA